MAKTLRCRLGKHAWRLRKGRINDSEEERTYYWCPDCGKTREQPPGEAGFEEAPVIPGSHPGPY